MLKIKDNVDLKELEKFGFKLNKDNEYEYKNYYPLEDDGTRYEDENGFDYLKVISVISNFCYRVGALKANEVGEIYLHNGIWKFHAVGNGVKEDLAGLCRRYGVNVS